MPCKKTNVVLASAGPASIQEGKSAIMAQDFHSTSIGVAAQKIESAMNYMGQALGDGLNDIAGAVAGQVGERVE